MVAILAGDGRCIVFDRFIVTLTGNLAIKVVLAGIYPAKRVESLPGSVCRRVLKFFIDVNLHHIMPICHLDCPFIARKGAVNHNLTVGQWDVIVKLALLRRNSDGQEMVGVPK
jgi:hypothetical protein